MSYGAAGPMIARLPTASGAKAVTTATLTLFTVTGRIRVLGLFGYVSTVIGGANTIKVLVNPTVGADTDLSAITVIDSKAAGTMLGLTGVPTDQLQLGVAEGTAVYLTNPIVVAAGTIQAVTVGAVTGAIEWYLVWEPITSDAAVA